MSGSEDAVLVMETGAGLFQVRVDAGDTTFLADEPVAVGGLSSGPDPFELVAAGLGACTVMTMRLYARRKGWDVPALAVRIRHEKTAGARDRFHRAIRLDPSLSEEARAGLLAIADRCPVHRLLALGADIDTEMVLERLPGGHAEALHGAAAEAACAEEEA